MKLVAHAVAVVLALPLYAETCNAAQDYPVKPVRMVIGYPPGGAADTLGRILAPKLTERWPHPVVLDNRAGASGNIGAELVAKATPDGYTLLIVTLSHAVGAGLYPQLPFHPADSFSAVTLIAATTLVFVTHPASPFRNLRDVIDAAKARPGQLSFGSSGVGGSPHLAGELLKLQTGIDIAHVPYKGTGLSITDLLGGHIPLLMGALPGVFPHIKSGKMRALGVTTIKRSPQYPRFRPSRSRAFPATTSSNGSGSLHQRKRIRSASHGCTTSWQRCFRCVTWRRRSTVRAPIPLQIRRVSSMPTCARRSHAGRRW